MVEEVGEGEVMGGTVTEDGEDVAVRLAQTGAGRGLFRPSRRMALTATPFTPPLSSRPPPLALPPSPLPLL